MNSEIVAVMDNVKLLKSVYLHAQEWELMEALKKHNNVLEDTLTTFRQGQFGSSPVGGDVKAMLERMTGKGVGTYAQLVEDMC